MKLLINFYNDEIAVDGGAKTRKGNVLKLDKVKEIREDGSNIVILQSVGYGATIERRNLISLTALSEEI